jgi:Mrp family chromosome partitioning ATPase/capsular polysaccharide biosynthesis protein
MNQTTDATAIFAPLWRRKWLILGVAILVAVGTYFYYKHQPSLYSAKTQVYLGNGAEEQDQISSSGNGGKKASAPAPATQAVLINSSVVKEAVRRELRKQRRTLAVHAALHGTAKAKSAEKSQFLTISSEAHNARGAALLANITARVYIKQQNAKYQREVDAAISLTRRQLRRIEAGQLGAEAAAKAKSSSSGSGAGTGKATTSTSLTLQTATLSSKVNQLESDLAIVNVKQVNPAKGKASKLLSPHPRQNAIFGFAVGLLLAAIAAYALSRFDRRLRSLAAIEAALQTQILTVLPAVRRPIVHRDGQPTPSKSLREPLRRLHAALRAGNALEHDQDGGPRVILFVSPDAGDGKSTVLADLALVRADAGERVVVVEADFRRPVQAKLLELDAPQGLAEVLAGRLTIEEALQTVNLVRAPADVAPAAHAGGGGTAVVESSASGSVSVLVGSTAVANPPALLAEPAMAQLLRTLAEDFDCVLVDAPPPLAVSDVMPLLAIVNGIVVLARAAHTRDTSAGRLVELLARTASAPVLGAVANAVSSSDIEKYGFSSAYDKRRRRFKLIGR